MYALGVFDLLYNGVLVSVQLDQTALCHLVSFNCLAGSYCLQDI